MFSPRLLRLLGYTKTTKPEFTWRAAAKVLAPEHADDMQLHAVIHMLMGVYEEALSEPRFELPAGAAAVDILLAPIKGGFSIDWLGTQNTDTLYTVEQFYNAMVARMMSDLRLSSIDWLHDEEKSVLDKAQKLTM